MVDCIPTIVLFDLGADGIGVDVLPADTRLGQPRYQLASGGTFSVEHRVARGDRVDLRGRPLGIAALDTLSPESRKTLVGIAGNFLPTEWRDAMLGELFRLARLGELVIAGKELPLTADRPFVAFDPATLGYWRFHLALDEATPVMGEAAKYGAVTVFTAAEWKALSTPPPGAKSAPPKKTYTPTRLREWFHHRVADWPLGSPKPTFDECLAAARVEYDDLPPEREFKEIRDTSVPESWRKRGPRRPRTK